MLPTQGSLPEAVDLLAVIQAKPVVAQQGHYQLQFVRQQSTQFLFVKHVKMHRNQGAEKIALTRLAVGQKQELVEPSTIDVGRIVLTSDIHL